MNVELKHLGSFSVIGREVSSNDGDGFVQRAWKAANESFSDILPLAVKDDMGRVTHTWGLMSDFSHSLMPWENYFSEGLYLAGAEADNSAQPPEGWCKWTVPERDYLAVEIENGDYPGAFNFMVYFYIAYARYEMTGAAFDYTDLLHNKDYIYFPVKKKAVSIDSPGKKGLARCGLHCDYCFFDKCGGCETESNFCSFASVQPDKKCPNVTCSQQKGLKGCYECELVADCKKGFFHDDNIASISCRFVKKEGKAALETAIRNMIFSGFNYSKDLVELNDDQKRLQALYDYLNK